MKYETKGHKITVTADYRFWFSDNIEDWQSSKAMKSKEKQRKKYAEKHGKQKRLR